MDHTYRIADHIIPITSIYEYVHTMCRAYRVDAPDPLYGSIQEGTGQMAPELEVSITQADIGFERGKSDRQAHVHRSGREGSAACGPEVPDLPVFLVQAVSAQGTAAEGYVFGKADPSERFAALTASAA